MVMFIFIGKKTGWDLLSEFSPQVLGIYMVGMVLSNA